MNRFSLSAVHAVTFGVKRWTSSAMRRQRRAAGGSLTFVKDCYVQNSLQFQSRSTSLGSGRSRGWRRCRRRRCARALREGAPVLGDLNGKDQNQDRPGPPRTTDEHLGRPPLSRRRPARRGRCPPRLQSRTRARLVTMCRFDSYQQGTRSPVNLQICIFRVENPWKVYEKEVWGCGVQKWHHQRPRESLHVTLTVCQAAARE